MAIIVIFGKPATGKTHHKQAFAKHYGCDTIVDNWIAWEHEVPADGRLVLTYSHPHEIIDQFQKDAPDQPLRLISILEARTSIGAAPYSPYIAERLSR